MSEAMSKTAQTIRASGDVRWRVESIVCGECQAVCWHIEAWAYDLLGEDAKACLLYREHLGSQSEALLLIARWMMRHAGQLRAAEDAAWLLEHQGTLW